MPQNQISNNRLALQYFPDTDHYRQQDLQTWLPELQKLGVGWLILRASADRAIPEDFVRALLAAGIQPVLHFHFSPVQPPTPEELQPLFQAYSNWGVRYVVLFDRPNSRASWDGVSWARQDLVTNFLTIYLPLAETAHEIGLINVFPPLEPGGDYWDTAFLEASLNLLQNSPHAGLLKRMALGVYAWADNLPLDWGAGGPECWPAAQPYFTPTGEEDHLGFRIFDWYSAICEATLGRALPQFGIGGGCRLAVQRPEHPPLDVEGHAEASLHLLQLLDGEEAAGMPPLPGLVIACSLGLLTAPENSPSVRDAWFPPNSTPLPTVARIQAGRSARQPRPLAKQISTPALGRHKPGIETTKTPSPASPAGKQKSAPETIVESFTTPGVFENPAAAAKPIRHYVLLPSYEWGIADWHLSVIQPFLNRHLPAVGFSIQEAAAAARVTVIGGTQAFSEAQLDELRTAGCTVIRISGDGTTIATQLETL